MTALILEPGCVLNLLCTILSVRIGLSIAVTHNFKIPGSYNGQSLFPTHAACMGSTGHGLDHVFILLGPRLLSLFLPGLVVTSAGKNVAKHKLALRVSA